MNNNIENMNIDKSKFDFAQNELKSDLKIQTKSIGYFKDAWLRFKRNKGSVFAFGIICFLILFALIAPVAGKTNYTTALNDKELLYYKSLLPKSEFFSQFGVWNGCSEEVINESSYIYYDAVGIETGQAPINKVKNSYSEMGGDLVERKYYTVDMDSYYRLGLINLTLTKEQYQNIMDFQDEKEVQVIFPAVDHKTTSLGSAKNDANIWYKTDRKGRPDLDKDGNFQSIYLKSSTTTYSDEYTSKMKIEGTEEGIHYATIGGSADARSYVVRVSLYEYFNYKYGYEPTFLFGTNASGQDIFTRLGNGARFSFLLAIFISVINLSIGAVYGAIAGFYGGTADLAMERIRDILGGIPFIVVTTLFQLHLKDKVGILGALLFAFVITGWLGMAGTVRMQFYRYKNQEYVLAAKTLGAKNKRLMFKHIFPNALGTIITSCVLVIPGVIFMESSLTYLGIVNLESSSITSVGTLLANGKNFLATKPHIILFPAIFISLLMISFNLFGNGLRDAFNPSLRGADE